MIYGDAAGFVAYHEARGKDIPGTWDNDAQNAALLAASEWIDGVYASSFIGYKTGGFEQEREWPRTNAIVTVTEPYFNIPTDQIPDRVKNAAYEAAFRELTTPGSLQPDYVPGKYKSVTVEGAISVDFVLFGAATDLQIQIGAIDKWLWPLLNASSASNRSGYSGGACRV